MKHQNLRKKILKIRMGTSLSKLLSLEYLNHMYDFYKPFELLSIRKTRFEVSILNLELSIISGQPLQVSVRKVIYETTRPQEVDTYF